jgi:hypothetical protein
MTFSGWLKILIALCGSLALLAALYFYRQVPRYQKPFAPLSEKVQRVRLQQGPATLELALDGKEWKVYAGTAPVVLAQGDKVKSLLSGLENVALEDVISDRVDRAAEFEVSPELGRRVTLFDAKAVILADGLFGKMTPDTSHLYFRFPDKPQVYLARGIRRYELGEVRPAGWQK